MKWEDYDQKMETEKKMIEYVCITHVEITDPTEPKIPNSVMLQIPYVELVASKIWNG